MNTCSLYLLTKDERHFRDVFASQIHRGMTCHFFSEPQSLFDAAVTADLVLFDIDSCQQNMTPLLQLYHQKHPKTPMIVLVNPAQSRLASDALQAGAVDYLQKPFTPSQLQRVVADCLLLKQPQQNLIATSAVSQKVLQLARRVAHTNATVLITGESGTGKERLAQFIHQHSPRANGPFVAVNCAAIPETILEATLFGVTKGAYTGAIKSQLGKFEQANGGTLLLDEIGEMPVNLQAKLLRVIQEREVERLGSHEKIKLDFRLIAATNQDLRMQVANGQFRQDLFYRLDVLPMSWPGLRARKEDIVPLARHFLKKYAPDQQYDLSREAQQALIQYRWPGNVRELENVIQRALILANGQVLQAHDFQIDDDLTSAMIQAAPSIQHSPSIVTTPSDVRQPASLADSRQLAEFQYVLEILQKFHGHRTRTAAALGMTTRALRYKLAAMRENGIDIDCLFNT